MKCKRHGCDKKVTVKQQVYCSRECAPFGYLVDPRASRKCVYKKKPGRPRKQSKQGLEIDTEGDTE